MATYWGGAKYIHTKPFGLAPPPPTRETTSLGNGIFHGGGQRATASLFWPILSSPPASRQHHPGACAAAPTQTPDPGDGPGRRPGAEEEDAAAAGPQQDVAQGVGEAADRAYDTERRGVGRPGWRRPPSGWGWLRRTPARPIGLFSALVIGGKNNFPMASTLVPRAFKCICPGRKFCKNWST